MCAGNPRGETGKAPPGAEKANLFRGSTPIGRRKAAGNRLVQRCISCTIQINADFRIANSEICTKRSWNFRNCFPFRHPEKRVLWKVFSTKPRKTGPKAVETLSNVPPQPGIFPNPAFSWKKTAIFPVRFRPGLVLRRLRPVQSRPGLVREGPPVRSDFSHSAPFLYRHFPVIFPFFRRAANFFSVPVSPAHPPYRYIKISYRPVA